MPRKKMLEMLKRIVCELDYDIYKQMFEYNDATQEEYIEKLLDIIKQYVK